MRSQRPDERSATFHWCLTDALQGRYPPTETGLAPETIRTVRAVADAATKRRPLTDLVAKAQQMDRRACMPLTITATAYVMARLEGGPYHGHTKMVTAECSGIVMPTTFAEYRYHHASRTFRFDPERTARWH